VSVSVEQARVQGTTSPLRRLPRLLLFAAAALFLALLAYGLTTTGRDDAIDQRLADGRSAPAPGFSLEVLERGSLPTRLGSRLAPALRDGKLGLKELRGTPFVLNFWASWCSPCREEAPLLEKGWQRSGRRGVLFVGLDMQDVRDDARGFIRKQKTTYLAIRDSGKDTAKHYGATGIPETYFVSARGQVVAHVIGVVSRAQLDSGIAAAVAGRPLGKEQGGDRRKPR
jgi:cytochrome c biogenesis protein CcmG/thiol:disulfide interchange protein DsbE